MDLSNNKLSGPIPPELGNLANLKKLDLVGNALTGPIPPELGNLGIIRELDLSNNMLSGPIPPELGNLGTLPVAEGVMQALYFLNNDGLCITAELKDLLEKNGTRISGPRC